jgi:hypothetical protein
VKNRFQNLPFKFNLQRYTTVRKIHRNKREAVQQAAKAVFMKLIARDEVGRCTLNSTSSSSDWLKHMSTNGKAE